MIFNNSKIYDTLKWLVLTALPAISAAIIELGEIWNIANTTQIAATIGVITAVLGALVGISGVKYANKTNEGE